VRLKSQIRAFCKRLQIPSKKNPPRPAGTPPKRGFGCRFAKNSSEKGMKLAFMYPKDFIFSETILKTES
jgi:hypothetical protein